MPNVDGKFNDVWSQRMSAIANLGLGLVSVLLLGGLLYVVVANDAENDREFRKILSTIQRELDQSQEELKAMKEQINRSD